MISDARFSRHENCYLLGVCFEFLTDDGIMRENKTAGLFAAVLFLVMAVLSPFAAEEPASVSGIETEEVKEESWPVVDAETSLSGLVGGLGVLLLAAAVGSILKLGFRNKTSPEKST